MTGMVLALAGLTCGDGGTPGVVSSEVEQRLELSGEWEGTIMPAWGQPSPARLVLQGPPFFNGVLHHVGDRPAGRRLYFAEVRDEGGGRLRLTILLGLKNAGPLLGIYKVDGDRLTICWRPRERPVSFRAVAGPDLLNLRRVRRKP